MLAAKSKQTGENKVSELLTHTLQNVNAHYRFDCEAGIYHYVIYQPILTSGPFARSGVALFTSYRVEQCKGLETPVLAFLLVALRRAS